MSGTSPDDHDAYHVAGLAGLYALNALEGEDLARFEAHLAGNAELQEEVAGFRATAARLAEVSAADAPGDLRARVLAGASATRQDAPVARLDARRGSSARSRLVLAAVAAVAVVLAGVAGFLVANRDDGTATQLASLLARADTKVVPLIGADSSTPAGNVVVSAAAGKVIVVSGQMPPTAPGRTYELWKLDAAGAHDAGLFEPDASGKVAAALDVSLDGATGFAITDEPDGGSAQATTPILMQATLE